MHAYKEAVQDRDLYVEPATRNRLARLRCSECSFRGTLTMRTLMPQEQIDKKFIQKGWHLDPAMCPTCLKARSQRRKSEIKAAVLNEPLMLMPTPEPVQEPDDVFADKLLVILRASVEHDPEPTPKPAKEPYRPTHRRKLKPKYSSTTEATEQDNPMNNLADNNVLRMVSVDTHKAAAKMHQLLSLHFDGETGHFEAGWNDERIANETGLSTIHVSEVRDVAYGKLKEPTELVALRNDVRALQELINETLAGAQKEINALNERIALVSRGLGFKA